MQEPAFPKTSWTAVRTARDSPDHTAAIAALGRLCESYWYPLYAFARRRGLSPEDAEDATQTFLGGLAASRLLNAADPARGKLRTLLLRAFENDLRDNRRAASREKRGGGTTPVSLDRMSAEERLAAEPAVAAPESYDRDWAVQVLDAAVARTEAGYAEGGRGAQFSILRPFITAEPDYGHICTALSLEPPAARQAVHRIRERFARALREEIAATLLHPTEGAVDEELAALRAALGH